VLNSFIYVLKRSLSAHLIQVKLLLFTFYLNGGLHAVSIGKPSEWMSNFWTVQFLKTESEPNFGFPHVPSNNMNNMTTDKVP